MGVRLRRTVDPVGTLMLRRVRVCRGIVLSDLVSMNGEWKGDVVVGLGMYVYWHLRMSCLEGKVIGSYALNVAIMRCTIEITSIFDPGQCE